MPLFSSSQFDQAVAKATSENNTSEDWETIMDIVDKIQVTPNGPKDCLRSIIKRLNSNVPHHIIHALTLLDSCIQNCGKKFHLQVCSHEFEVEVKKILIKKSHPIVIDKLKIYLERWCEIFKNDPELSLIPSLYNSLKYDKDYQSSEVQPTKTVLERSKDSTSTAQKEEDDIAKAIELSLKDTPSKESSAVTKNEPGRKVRALYDFLAAEENELTFHEGEVLTILDDSDRNWWKGSNRRGEGLFPANFVTLDLNAEKYEKNVSKEKRKSVQFDDEVKVKEVPLELEEVVIDEAKIDMMLHLLHEADPTGDHDSDELLALEDRCLAMSSLIDKELVDIDRRHASLSAANNGLVESLNMYETLMKDFSFTPYPAGYQNFSVPGAYHSAEAYHPVCVPSSGSLPNLRSGPILYGANSSNYSSSGVYYGDNPHQPML